MIFIKDEAFACEKCIRGHRTATCKHDTRPLKKVEKGRPKTQCESCRLERKHNKRHLKCFHMNTAAKDKVKPTSFISDNNVLPHTIEDPSTMLDLFYTDDYNQDDTLFSFIPTIPISISSCCRSKKRMPEIDNSSLFGTDAEQAALAFKKTFGDDACSCMEKDCCKGLDLLSSCMCMVDESLCCCK